MLTPGCAEKADPVIALEVRASDPTLKFDAAAADAMARAAIEKLGLAVRPAKPGERRWQAVVEVARRSGKGARPEEGKLPADRIWREVAATLDLRAVDKPADPAGRMAAMRYRGEAFIGENVGVFDDDRALVERAIARSGDDLVALLALEKASDAVIVAAIDDPDLVRASRAIEQARERRLAAAYAPLVAVVADPGPRTHLIAPAIGALVALEDPRATTALIDATKNRPPIVVLPIIFAVAEIGGREAEAWLFTVGSGHPDREVRDAAKQALEELERRRRNKEEPR